MSSGKIVKNIKPVDKVIFLNTQDTTVEFKSSCILDFPKYLKTGIIDINNNVYSGQSKKICIRICIVYKWLNADYAPRYNIEIVKNNLVDKKSYMGLSDVYDYSNVANETFVINVQNNDVIQIRLVKADGVDYVEFANNSFVEFSVF